MQAALGSRSWEGGCARRLCTHARGFVLTLAGECPLFSAWGRFEDGAPTPHEHLRRCVARNVNDEA